jgi:hypothetical protein
MAYLARLPVRPVTPPVQTRARQRPALRLLGLLVLLPLLGGLVLAVGSLGHLVSGPALPIGRLAAGCLEAPVEPLFLAVASGHASLCATDGRVYGSLDIEQLEPSGHYSALLAYFEHPGLCSWSALLYQVPHFTRPCTLADLDGPTPPGVLMHVGDAAASWAGGVHLDGFTEEIQLAPHAQAWLLLERWPTPRPGPPGPSASFASRYVERGALEVRAIFDVP